MDLIWLVLALPLLGSLINGLLGRHLPKRLIGWVACGSVGLAFLISLRILFDLLALSPNQRVPPQTLFDWISVSGLSTQISLLVDPLSTLMILVVTGVGFLIHVYSVGYMSHDSDYSRYFSWLNLFTFSMLVLVLADNFLLLFVGWELVGLCSYLLIGFWFTRPSAAAAAKKAFIVNRIGDFGFLIGLFLLFATFGTLDYLKIFEAAAVPHALPELTATVITLLLFAGAVGKSAQIPLYVWLPDAMEGPTPVSALIHAATMVTAGVYMVARSHDLYMLAPFSMNIVAAVGAVTALMAASIALVNNDIKRVLAYSTVSQLGYMFLAAGVGAFSAGMFHLTSHAFMKALLFLAAGSVMHALGGEETDMRKMGGLRKVIPWTWGVFLIGALAMSGIFPLVGFFSKDLILEEAFSNDYVALWLIGLFTALLTAFYMLRAYFLTFHGKPRYDEKAVHPHESPAVMLWPLRGLAALTIIGGILWISWMGFTPLNEFLSPVFAGVAEGGREHTAALSEGALIAISLLVALAGIGIAWLVYIRGFQPGEALRKTFRPFYTLLEGKYYVDELYYSVIVQPGRLLSQFLATVFDLRLLDGLVNGVGALIDRAGGALRRVESGYIRNYAAWVLLGTLGILIYWLMR
ncbi:MAG: NADH-quinone oxidoreductase subunit L [Candidatus Fraserbacteria bacterium RBG_16_55_9]|uniref:NADH-quinone oxidoreductase subunit L n=1 Tax=Fraserbacteria sp. (strain RBG_16_55_9) TaxID=1817864 RepID=A0A1F5UPI5_FRAXR|nr:MAG: NADH-quinone oxidoreductase subunit L [Candidatus Fraserbacteria bacterium RBG_16_55_9]